MVTVERKISELVKREINLDFLLAYSILIWNYSETKYFKFIHVVHILAAFFSIFRTAIVPNIHCVLLYVAGPHRKAMLLDWWTYFVGSTHSEVT